jgi:predicted RNase H-like HicB family nuclease
MLQYKAGYKFLDDGVHAQVTDFPGVFTCAQDLAEAKRLLALALMDMAEAAIETGSAIPTPNPLASDAEMDIEEPIYLHLSVSSGVVASASA